MSSAIFRALFLVALTVAPCASSLAVESSVLTPAPTGADVSRSARPSTADASMQALCKDVDVQLDEGYGVSGYETRLVCRQMN